MGTALRLMPRADANRQKGIEGEALSAVPRVGIEEDCHPFSMHAAFGACPPRLVLKFISLFEFPSCALRTGAHGGQAFFGYSTYS